MFLAAALSWWANFRSLDGSVKCVAESDPQQNVGQGSLLVIDKQAYLVNTFTSATHLKGPWDLTLKDEGHHARVFVTNALEWYVTRLDLRINEHHHAEADEKGGGTVVVEKSTKIPSDYVHRCDPAAFVVGPTDVAFLHR